MACGRSISATAPSSSAPIPTAPMPADQSYDGGIPPVCKNNMMTWRILGAVLALLVVMGWVFIIVMLILEEKWQLVLVAWLLLYSAAHFCYWYCKRHSLITLHRQIRVRVLRGQSCEKSEDGPPTYQEVMETEAPPPAYFTVITETNKQPTVTPAPTIVPTHTPTSAPTIEATSVSASACEDSDAPPTYISTVSEVVANGGKKLTPPEYHTPKNLRKLSPRILPKRPHPSRLPTDSAVTATVAATAAATIAAALTQMPSSGSLAWSSDEDDDLVEDPIRGPIMKHLRSTTIATLDVATEGVTHPSLAAVAPEHIQDLQAPSGPASFP